MAINPEAILQLIALNGGKIVGKTRLQKSLYLLESRDLGFGFDFEYYLFGPFSDDANFSLDDAEALKLIKSERKMSDRAEYFVFQALVEMTADDSVSERRKALLSKLQKFDPISLELAATADFLSRNGYAEDAWSETAMRKPSKATPERMQRAKKLLSEIAE